jgi:hypothetical protein
MQVLPLTNWEEYKSMVGRLCNFPAHVADDHFFRGMSHASWVLTSTLDRVRTFESAALRGRFEDALLRQFRQELIRLGTSEAAVPDGDALALLARHHGLPSSWIDWTTSPYVAAYFAFAGSGSEDVAIWYQSRSWLPEEFAPADLIDDPDLLKFNPRALRQRGLFLRAAAGSEEFVRMLDAGLIKFILPAAMKRVGLEELDAMTINATNLFADYDGAARTAVDRVSRRIP